jgi:hypothetical protein
MTMQGTKFIYYVVPMPLCVLFFFKFVYPHGRNVFSQLLEAPAVPLAWQNCEINRLTAYGNRRERICAPVVRKLIIMWQDETSFRF